MLVSHSWCEETANDILYEIEQLLCDNDIKINNKDPKQNKFEREDSYINVKDYNELKEKTKHLNISLSISHDHNYAIASVISN